MKITKKKKKKRQRVRKTEFCDDNKKISAEGTLNGKNCQGARFILKKNLQGKIKVQDFSLLCNFFIEARDSKITGVGNCFLLHIKNLFVNLFCENSSICSFLCQIIYKIL